MPVPRHLALLALLILAALGLTSSAGPAADPRRDVPELSSPAAFQRLPLAFTPGPASSDGPTFQAAGDGYAASLSAGGDAVVRLRSGDAVHDLHMSLAGGSSRPAAEGRDVLGGRTHYLLGNDRRQWRTDVARFAAVHYEDVYPGVDLVYHGQARKLEYDFVVAPGVDPNTIDVALDGAEGLTVDEGGDLVVNLASGPHPAVLRMAKPVIYQDIDGDRRLVAGKFVLRGPERPDRAGGRRPERPDRAGGRGPERPDRAGGRGPERPDRAGGRGPERMGFQVGPYDRSRPLVIDPVLVGSSYLGGSGIDSSYGVAVDGSGNSYLTGYTESTDFQTVNPVQPTLNEGPGVRTDAFVTKLNPAGTEVLSATYFGGGDRDTGRSIAVGADGAVYVAGTTESSDFPTTRPLQPTYGGGTSDAFLVKLGNEGSGVDYATTIGGSALDEGNGIAVDGAGNAFVAGSTTSTNFPTLAPVQGSLGGETDAFVAKVGADGSAFVYSTYLGGGADEHALAVALNRAGEAYVTGDTSSQNFPTVRPFQPRYGGLDDQAGRGSDVAGDAFVTHLDGAGSALVYSTYLGGNDSDSGAGIALDRDGTAYVAGSTGSANFPLAEALQSRKAGDFDAFITAVNPSGTELVYSTYLGGESADGAAGVTVDAEGRSALVGATSSSDFPTVDAFQSTKGGGFVDGFVATLNQSGSRLELSSYVGGDDEDQATALAVDADGTVHVTGYTNSPNFPTARPFRPQKAGAVGDAFITEIAQAGLGGEAASSARDTRLRLLIGTTIGLFLAAGLLTLWLRRRARAPSGPDLAEPGPERPQEAPVRAPEAPVRAPEAPVGAGTSEASAVRGPGPPRRAGGPQPEPVVPPGSSRPGRPERPGERQPELADAGTIGRDRPAGADADQRGLRRDDDRRSSRPPQPERRLPRARPAPPRPPAPGRPQDPRPDPRAPFTPPGGLLPEPPLIRSASSAIARPDTDRLRGPFTPPGGLVPTPAPSRADAPAPPAPPAPSRADAPPPAPPAPPAPSRADAPPPPAPPAARRPPERETEPPGVPVPDILTPVEHARDEAPPAVDERPPTPAPASEAEPAVLGVPDLLSPIEPPDEPPAGVDVFKPDLWETTEPSPAPPVEVTKPDLWSTTEPAPEEPPELAAEELAAWELLISSPVPSDFDEAETDAASSVTGAENAAPGPEQVQSGGRPDLWNEDLPITPSSEPGSGDEWLRLLWSEDLPLPDKKEAAESPPEAESPKGPEPGEGP